MVARLPHLRRFSAGSVASQHPAKSYLASRHRGGCDFPISDGSSSLFSRGRRDMHALYFSTVARSLACRSLLLADEGRCMATVVTCVKVLALGVHSLPDGPCAARGWHLHP